MCYPYLEEMDSLKRRLIHLTVGQFSIWRFHTDIRGAKQQHQDPMSWDFLESMFKMILTKIKDYFVPMI